MGRSGACQATVAAWRASRRTNCRNALELASPSDCLAVGRALRDIATTAAGRIGQAAEGKWVESIASFSCHDL